MQTTTAQNTLKYIEASNALSKRAMAERQAMAADRQKVASSATQLVQDMVGAEMVGAHQEEKAAEMLGTHEGTAQLLKGATDKIADLTLKLGQKTANDLGDGVSDDQAGGATEESVINPNYMGQRTGEKRGSDEAFLTILNAPGN
jgi:hypothetical protein